jgi:hypothetical protein
MALVNVGQYTNIGFGPESTYATGVVPTYFPGYEAWSPTPKNTMIPRPDSRQRSGQAPFATGGYDFSATLRPSPQPDVLFPLLKYAFGAQTTPVPAPTTTVQTTIATGDPVAAGATTITVTSATGITTNMYLAVDTGIIQEVVKVASIASNVLTLTTGTQYAHAALVNVYKTSSTAFGSQLSFGHSIPSLTIEYVRASGDATDYLGCMIDSVKLSCSPNKELQADFAIVGANEVIQSSPATPTFPATLPLISEAAPQFGAVYYKGVALSGVLLEKWDLSLNNQLEKSFRTVGSRFLQYLPIGQRKVSGSIQLSYSGPSQYEDFLGATSATSPQAAITGLTLGIAVASNTYADSTNSVPYQIMLCVPNLYPTGDPIPGKVSGSLVQTLSFDAAEVNGQNNDLYANIISLASAVY